MASASASNELRELPMTKPLVLLSEQGEFEQRFSVFFLIDRKLSRPICGHANPRPSCRSVLCTVSISISINLLVVYRESVNLIGYITRRLSPDSQQL